MSCERIYRLIILRFCIEYFHSKAEIEKQYHPQLVRVWGGKKQARFQHHEVFVKIIKPIFFLHARTRVNFCFRILYLSFNNVSFTQKSLLENSREFIRIMLWRETPLHPAQVSLDRRQNTAVLPRKSLFPIPHWISCLRLRVVCAAHIQRCTNPRFRNHATFIRTHLSAEQNMIDH